MSCARTAGVLFVAVAGMLALAGCYRPFAACAPSSCRGRCVDGVCVPGGDAGAGADGGRGDAGQGDAGPGDAGQPDAGGADAGASDAGADGGAACTPAAVSPGWNAAASPTTSTLRAVWASSDCEAWAVGDDLAVAHWDGASWKAVPAPPACANASCPLRAVVGMGAGIYVAGDAGEAALWDGAKWSAMPGGATLAFTSLATDGASLYAATLSGSAWVWASAGSTWTPLSGQPPGSTVSALSGLPGQVFGAGAQGWLFTDLAAASGFQDGTRAGFTAVAALDGLEACAVAGTSFVSHWSGGAWSTVGGAPWESLWGRRDGAGNPQYFAGVAASGTVAIGRCTSLNGTAGTLPGVRAFGGTGGLVWAVGDSGHVWSYK